MRLTPVLFAAFLLCSSLQAEDHSLSAAEKEQETWQQVVATRYGALPEFASPGFWDATNLFSAEYDSKAFSHESDVMIEGRAKLIHGFGSSILVAFVPEPNSPYTGLLGAGAPFGILRVSLAKPPTDDVPATLIPGFGLKFFIDGRSSLNILAMPSLDGQDNENIFAFPYTTHVPEPAFSVKGAILGNRFTAALGYVGQPDGNPRSFSIEHLARWTSMGEEVSKPHAPFALAFVARDLNALMTHRCASDFRVCLQEKGQNLTLFDVLAITMDNERKKIGRLVAKTNFLASKFGDDSLFFQHPPVHNWSDPAPKDDL